MYCYITLTASTETNFAHSIPTFLDCVQKINEMLPLRIVPLRITEFTPVKTRMNKEFENMMVGQYNALRVWNEEMTKRFSKEQISQPITDVTLRKK